MIDYYKKSLLNMLITLKKVKKNPYKNFLLIKDLQLAMLDKIKIIEAKIIKLNKEREKLKNKINKSNPEEKKAFGILLKRKKDRIQEYKELIIFIKNIGVGIVFSFFDKYDIKHFAFKQDNGFISGKKGLKKEMKVFNYLWNNNQVAILNDLTNSLRYGDITVAVINKGNIIPQSIEVKTTPKKSKKNIRQQDKLNKANEYIINDKVKDLYDNNIELVRKSLGRSSPSYIKKFNDVINKSYKKGYCIRKIEKGLFYCVFKNERWIDRLSKVKFKKAYSYFPNQEKYQIKSISPLTLIIDNPNHVIDYYKGDFCILIICDISRIEEKLKKAKMIVQIEPADSDYILKITNINNKEFSDEKGLVMKVSVYFFNRFLIECDSLKWFIEELIKRYDYMVNYYANLEKKQI